MKRLETQELTKLSDSDLVKRLNDLRSEFSKLQSGAARGILKKELGEIKTVRRNIARVLTVINARHQAAEKTRNTTMNEPAQEGKKDKASN